MSLEEKWKEDKQPLQPLKNSNLVCNTCKKCLESVTECKAYTIKPISVLKGGVCYEYKKS
jgi:hypothetical protein